MCSHAGLLRMPTSGTPDMERFSKFWYACRWHRRCQVKRNGNFGTTPFYG